MNKLYNESKASHKNSRLKNSSGRFKKKSLEKSYDERVIPTLMKKVKTEESQEANFDERQE